MLGDFSPSSPLHLAKTTTALTATSFSQSPSSPPFCGMPHQPTTTTTPTTTAARATPGRLEFSPEKAGMDVTPLNLDFLDRSQLPPQPLALASLTGKLNIFYGVIHKLRIANLDCPPPLTLKSIYTVNGTTTVYTYMLTL